MPGSRGGFPSDGDSEPRALELCDHNLRIRTSELLTVNGGVKPIKLQ